MKFPPNRVPVRAPYELLRTVASLQAGHLAHQSPGLRAPESAHLRGCGRSAGSCVLRYFPLTNVRRQVAPPHRARARINDTGPRCKKIQGRVTKYSTCLRSVDKWFDVCGWSEVAAAEDFQEVTWSSPFGPTIVARSAGLSAGERDRSIWSRLAIFASSSLFGVSPPK